MGAYSIPAGTVVSAVVKGDDLTWRVVTGKLTKGRRGNFAEYRLRDFDKNSIQGWGESLVDNIDDRFIRVAGRFVFENHSEAVRQATILVLNGA